jgi:tetratricopeptide (TPR) repeat protein
MMLLLRLVLKCCSRSPLTHHFAYQLVGKYDIAIQTLEAHESALREMPVNFEHSELLMYHNRLLEEKGDIEAALEHLSTIEPKVCDKRSLKEKRAQFLLKLNKSEEAEKAYRQLISENPDSYAYIRGLIAVKGLDSGIKVNISYNVNRLIY